MPSNAETRTALRKLIEDRSLPTKLFIVGIGLQDQQLQNTRAIVAEAKDLLSAFDTEVRLEVLRIDDKHGLVESELDRGVFPPDSRLRREFVEKRGILFSNDLVVTKPAEGKWSLTDSQNLQMYDITRTAVGVLVVYDRNRIQFSNVADAHVLGEELNALVYRITQELHGPALMCGL